MPQLTDVVIQVDSGDIAYIGKTAGVVLPDPPIITLHPSAVTLTEPASHTFTADAIDYDAINWQVSTPPGGTFADIPGQTATSYGTGPTSHDADDGKQFRLRATNAGGTVYSDPATLSVIAIPVVSSISLSGPIASTVGVAASGTVFNTGTTAQSWTLASSPAATITPSSGTTAAGASTSFTVTAATAGSYSVSLSNTSGGTVSGSPDVLVVSDGSFVVPDAPAMRNAGAYLFQPSLQQRTHGPYTYKHESSVGGINNSGLYAAAPSYNAVDELCDWLWTHPGGDWIDAAGVEQGTTHHNTYAMNAGGFQVYPSIDVTNLVRWVQEHNWWNAWIVGRGASTSRTIGGLHNTDPAKRPILTVTYTDTTTATLACRLTGGLASGNPDVASTFAATYSLPCLMEFDPPTKPVASATLSLYQDTQWSGTQPLTFNPVNPTRRVIRQPQGIAATLPFDAGLSALPGVIYAHTMSDGTLESDVIAPSVDNVNMVDADFDPKLNNDALTADTSKLPWLHYGKWINAQYANPKSGNLTLVPSTYTGEGFAPLAPGLGALKTTIVGTPGLTDGSVTDASGETGCIARLFLPFDKCGSMTNGRGRFYARFHTPRPLVFDDRKIVNASDTISAVNWSGKWGPGFTHDTSLGGFSGSSGDGLGWQWRLQYLMNLHGVAGPAEGTIALGTHCKADFQGNSPISYQGFREQWGDNGTGGIAQFDAWYCIEYQLILNTLKSDGVGYNQDGEFRVWVNGVKAFERTGLVLRSLPINPGVGVPTAVPGGGNTGSVTFTHGHTVSSGIIGGRACPETITLTFDGAGGYTVVGSFYGTYLPGTVGAAYTSVRQHKWTITGTPGAGDTLVITYPTNPSVRTPIRDLGIRDWMLNFFHGGKTEPGVDFTMFATGFAMGDGDEMAGPFGPMLGVHQNNGGLGTLDQAEGTVAMLGSANASGEFGTLEEISPEHMAWNPDAGDGPWGGSGGRQYGFHTSFAYCGISWDSYSRKIMGFGAGHVAYCVPVPWAFDVPTATYSWLAVPPPTDAFALTNGSSATPALLGSLYPALQLDPDVGEWKGDWSGWPAGYGRPGEIFVEPGHSYQNLVFVPPPVSGTANGLLLPCVEPSGNSTSPINRNQHYFDLDDNKWKRTANKCATLGANAGAAAYLPTVGKVVSITSSASTNRALVDVWNPATRAWSQVSCTSAAGGLPITPEYGGIREHEQFGLTLAFCPTDAGGALVSENGVKQRIWAVASSALVAGASTWQELTLTVASWPLLAGPTVAGSSPNVMSIGWAYCHANGKFYAVDGRHNSTTLWVLTPPSAATDAASAIAGTWAITTETLSQPISSRNSAGSANAASVYNRLIWDQTDRVLLYVEEYVNAQVQRIKPAGV